jgi:hypothetical protein
MQDAAHASRKRISIFVVPIPGVETPGYFLSPRRGFRSRLGSPLSYGGGTSTCTVMGLPLLSMRLRVCTVTFQGLKALAVSS